MAPGTATDEVRELLKDYLSDRRRDNARALSLRAGLGETAVKDILRGKSKKLSLDSHSKLLNAIESKYPGWLIEKGALSPVGGVVQVPSLDRTTAYPVAQIVLSQKIPPDRLVALRVKGPAMEPTLSEGDLVVADTGARQIDDGSIYVVRAGDRAVVARIRRRLDQPDRFDILHDNPRVPPATLGENEIEVVGRVVVMTRAL